MQIYQKWDLRRTAYLEFVNGSISPANFDANAASCRYQEEVFKYFTMQVPGNVHGNNVQPSRKAFSVLWLLNMVRLCCSLFSQWLKRPVGFGVLSGFGSLVGGIASFGNGKGVCVVYDRNGSIDLAKDGF